MPGKLEITGFCQPESTEGGQVESENGQVEDDSWSFQKQEGEMASYRFHINLRTVLRMASGLLPFFFYGAARLEAATQAALVSGTVSIFSAFPNISVVQGQSLSITATGTVCFGNPCSDPNLKAPPGGSGTAMETRHSRHPGCRLMP